MKSPLKSKTIIFNSVAAIIAAVQAIGPDIIDPQILGGIVVVGNLVLRFLTKTAIWKG